MNHIPAGGIVAKKVGNPGIVDTQRQGITDVPNPDANVAAAGAGTARKSVGRSAENFTNVSGAASPNTKRVAKKNRAAGDNAGPTGHRGQISAQRLGPQFTVSASYIKQIDPAAGSTQANGRIVPSAVVRSRESFDSERSVSY